MSNTFQSGTVTSALAPTSVLVSFLSALGVINFADRAVIGLAGPAIIAELHLSAAQWGIVGSSFFLLFSLSSLVVLSLSMVDNSNSSLNDLTAYSTRRILAS